MTRAITVVKDTCNQIKIMHDTKIVDSPTYINLPLLVEQGCTFSLWICLFGLESYETNIWTEYYRYKR